MTKTRQITLIAMLAALAVVGRLLLQPIPNVQPATIIVILTGVAFGWRMGSTLGIVIAAVSGILTGLGYWTPFQIAAWGIIGFISGFIPRRADLLFVWAMVSAFLFGIITSLSMLVTTPLLVAVTFYFAGIPFDAYHALGNVIFLLFAPMLLHIFDRVKARNGLT